LRLPAWLAKRGVSFSVIVDQPGTGEALRLQGHLRLVLIANIGQAVCGIGWKTVKKLMPNAFGMGRRFSAALFTVPRACAFEPRFACGV